MATKKQKIGTFTEGTHNLLPDEITPKDSTSDSLNWVTKDGKIELIYGRKVIGGTGDAGKNYAEHVAYKADGTSVRFRKVDGTIQYLNSSETWVDVITGLAETADYTCSNYQSLAGAFVYFFGEDGIYKVAVANPGDYASMYDEAKNFKGFGFIDKGRTILWGRKEDATGLYGSYIDGQDSTVYTAVNNENIGTGDGTEVTFTDTLDFKASGAKRTCFGIEVTDGTETFTDDFNGVLTGSEGGTGTINYMTGEISVTFDSAPNSSQAITADYQWEDSNEKGVTDFTKSATRNGGEGFVIRQDAGGDAIKVVLALDGSYFSMKENSCYQLTLDAADVEPVNFVFSLNIGVKTLRSATASTRGIILVNTANPSKPTVEILTRNEFGDTFSTKQLFPHYAFENFTYDDALLFSWDDYVIIGCKEKSGDNNRLLLCNIREKTVDKTYYGIRTAAQDGGTLYGGDPVSKTTYELFTGFDDNGIKIENYWESHGETFKTDALKKTKRYRFKGQIDPAQALKVQISFDDGDYTTIGTILGSGDYVDYGVTYAVGTDFIGGDTVGGGSETSVYNFFMEIKVRSSKFRKRNIRFVAEELGYVAIEAITDFDIWTYEDKMPKKYRIKNNVSIDGETTNQDNPEY